MASKRGKHPGAVALGKLGGAKGGKTRAERMTPEQRSEAARRAVEVRWGKRSAGDVEQPAFRFIECPACRRKGVSDQAFACPGCGHPLAPKCAECGRTLRLVICRHSD